MFIFRTLCVCHKAWIGYFLFGGLNVHSVFYAIWTFSILEVNASLEQVHVRINNMEKRIASIIKNRDNIRSYLKKMHDLDISFGATLTEDLEIKQ